MGFFDCNCLFTRHPHKSYLLHSMNTCLFFSGISGKNTTAGKLMMDPIIKNQSEESLQQLGKLYNLDVITQQQKNDAYRRMAPLTIVFALFLYLG